MSDTPEEQDNWQGIPIAGVWHAKAPEDGVNGLAFVLLVDGTVRYAMTQTESDAETDGD